MSWTDEPEELDEDDELNFDVEKPRRSFDDFNDNDDNDDNDNSNEGDNDE